ncbi:hypothetical protein [Kitasatospora acidiphila]|uniref:hypothetical protein n=1 Tax=Kitasatospora acidiphila TaxID=2567942 RepID=UPI003C71A98B
MLFSLGWVGVLAPLALGAVICLLLQYLTPGTPVRERTVPIPGWAKPFLALLGSSWFGIGAGLLAVPGFWGALLPWRVDRADAQALGVWALALGVGVLGGLVEDDLARLRPALLSLPGVAVVAGVLLGSRAGEVHWASGPGVSLIVMLAGLLASGGIGYRLLAQRTTGPNGQAGVASPSGPVEPAHPDGSVESARPDGPVGAPGGNG